MVHATAANPSSQFDSRLHLIEDARVGLMGAIAIDSTVLGPAAGGCRFWSYTSLSDLHADALRLARGMTYKNAMAGLPLGGGKAVIQVPSGPFDREALFRAFGEAVQALHGEYITAEDVGTTVQDMRSVQHRTGFVAGLDARQGRAGGDPSPWTAKGIFQSMAAAARFTLDADVSDVSVAIQGAGNVGSHLCALLVRAGARVAVSDIDPSRCAALAKTHRVDVLPPEDIASAQVDIFAPCALGGALNAVSVEALRARLVCGGANNQIADEDVACRMVERGITYVPDYVANAGGIINVSAEYLGETVEDVEARVGSIAPRVRDILAVARSSGRSPAFVADEMARALLSPRQGLAA